MLNKPSWLNLDYSDIESDPSTISASPPGIGSWSRSVNLTSHPKDGFSHRERRDRENTRRDRQACYFGVTQRYRTRRDRRCIFWQPIRLNRRSMCQMLALSSHSTCYINRTRKRGNSTLCSLVFRSRLG